MLIICSVVHEFHSWIKLYILEVLLKRSNDGVLTKASLHLSKWLKLRWMWHQL